MIPKPDFLSCTERVLAYGSPLSPLQRRYIWTSLVGLAENAHPDCESLPGDTLLFFAAGLLSTTQLLDGDQWRLLLEEAKTPIRLAGQYYDSKMCGKELAGDAVCYQIAFADREYATWTHRNAWLSLKTGNYVEELPVPPLETISYNLEVLANQAAEELQRRWQILSKPVPR